MKDRFPDRVTGSSAWTRDELAEDKSWIYYLSVTEINEIEAAIELVRQEGLKVYEFGMDDFPLETLSVRLDVIIEQVENGRGCALIKGLDPANYDEDTLKIIY